MVICWMCKTSLISICLAVAIFTISCSLIMIIDYHEHGLFLLPPTEEAPESCVCWWGELRAALRWSQDQIPSLCKWASWAWILLSSVIQTIKGRICQLNGSSEAALLTLMAVFWRRQPPAENKIQFSRREVGRLYVILCVQVEKLTGCS